MDEAEKEKFLLTIKEILRREIIIHLTKANSAKAKKKAETLREHQDLK